MSSKVLAEPVAPIEREGEPSLVAAIAGRLENMIISGEIESGGKLNEYALAQQLHVSSSALREAVRLLEQLGLVTIQPNRGVFVRRVSLKEALDLSTSAPGSPTRPGGSPPGARPTSRSPRSSSCITTWRPPGSGARSSATTTSTSASTPTLWRCPAMTASPRSRR